MTTRLSVIDGGRGSGCGCAAPVRTAAGRSPASARFPAPRRARDRLAALARELDRGMDVMYGAREPTPVRPADLDTLARTGLLGGRRGSCDGRHSR